MQTWISARKVHRSYCETCRGLCCFLGLLSYLWHRMSLICTEYNEILRLSMYSWEKRPVKCQRARSPSQVMDGSCNRIMTENTQLKPPMQGSEQKHWTIVKWPFMSPHLNPWKELKHSVERKQPSNQRLLEQFGHEEWPKIPADRCRSPIENDKNLFACVDLKCGILLTALFKVK